jgi:hypothetical protein
MRFAFFFTAALANYFLTLCALRSALCALRSLPLTFIFSLLAHSLCQKDELDFIHLFKNKLI